ncbi:MAG: 4Fe-4S binding protein [Elusimicrobia bacterium]|jgi:Pyruvate/2-oxoacid:ferredoxin oxidoreductase delta subunit|nr:4Fe-4S binding protein [Elusimicrobiota bacterium]
MSDELRPVVDGDMCTGCTICVSECPNDALSMVDDVAELTDEKACDGCGICEDTCPVAAIVME